jgi:hypothetical protein
MRSSFILNATVIQASRSFDVRSNGIWAVFVCVSSGRTLWGLFCKKNIGTTKELLDHRSNSFEELVSPKHLRCGSTWYSYIQENMRSSFILDATMIRASRSLDMGSKGIWVVFCTNCVQFSNSLRFPIKILRHSVNCYISDLQAPMNSYQHIASELHNFI